MEGRDEVLRPRDAGTDETAYRVPDPPRLTAALKDAAADCYLNFARFLAANLVWGGALIADLALLAVWPVGALLAAPLLALPTAAIFLLATRAVRGDSVRFREALTAWRSHGSEALVVGVVTVAASFAFLVNFVIGTSSRHPVGWGFATVNAWGFILLWTGTVVLWPLLLDPRRVRVGLRAHVRLAGLLVLAFPGRLGALTFLIGLLLVVSAIVQAALLTISISYVALLAARYVLPIADRFESRATEAIPE